MKKPPKVSKPVRTTRLFVYGSLMSRPELERAIGHAYEGAYIPYTLEGFRREWSSSEGVYAFLNLVEDAEARVEGFVVEVNDTDLEMLDVWEATYERVVLGEVTVYLSRAHFRCKGSLVSRRYWRLAQSAIQQPLPKLPSCLSLTDESDETAG